MGKQILLTRKEQLTLNLLLISNHHIYKAYKAFIQNIQAETTVPLVTDDMISMAHKFGLLVVAEGVEELVQVEYLRKHACDVLQGYHIGRPMKEADALDFILG